MKKVLVTGLTAFAAMTAAHSASVVNGTFDDVAPPPVYNAGSGVMTDNLFGPINILGYANTPDGANAGVINSSYNFLTGSTTGAISFLLADLAVGQAYQVSFIDAATSLSSISPNTFSVSYNGANIGSFTPGSTSWTSATTGVFTATNTIGTLTFTGQTVTGGSTRGVGIDGVTIAAAGGAAAVPEPATWAMMIGGFGMVGGALRRRRAPLSLA